MYPGRPLSKGYADVRLSAIRKSEQQQLPAVARVEPSVLPPIPTFFLSSRPVSFPYSSPPLLSVLILNTGSPKEFTPL